MTLLIIFFTLFLPALAQAQEIHHHEGASPEVDKFYSTWRQPHTRGKQGERVQSCCDKKDCHPAIIRFNKEKQRWEGRYADLTYQRDFWLVITDLTLEENHPDSRESPDGQSHMCGNSMHIYCAVRGGGT